MAFLNRFILKAVLVLSIHEVAILGANPSGSCSSQHQALMCKYVDSEHVELVREHLSKMAAEHSYFGIAFYNSKLEHFPEDIFKDYNITTFAHVADRLNLDEFPIANLLMTLRSKVTQLYLVASGLHSLDLERLKELPFRESLKFLDLRYNALDAIESDSFSEFPHLEELNLLGNNITRIPKHSFGGLEFLKRLILSESHVADIEEEAFKGLPSLTHLDLSKSKFSSIPKNAFVNLESLQTLDLSFNQPSFLARGIFNDEDLPKLSELKLEAIPFFCQCDLQWLKLWLTEKGLLTSSGAWCIDDMFKYKKFAVVDFCPDLDDDEIVEEETHPSEEEDEEEDIVEDDEDETDPGEDEDDTDAEEDDDYMAFKEEL